MGVTLNLRPFAWATLVANCMLVVTGGAVRLTGSGLGCPTWPRCTDESFTPHGALTMHSAIEFGNRMLTFVLVAVAVLTFLSALQSKRGELIRLSVVLALGIPAQAVIGGITVLTDLNPWIVSFHLICSLAIISLAVVYLWRIDGRLPRPAPLAWAMYAAVWVVLYIGTIVTGSGPHAGDADSPRNGLDPLQWSQLHADAVFLFLGLVVALVLVYRTRVAGLLLAVTLGQGAIGFVQYFTDLPIILVGTHMLGAAVLIAVATQALLVHQQKVQPA
ncbi:MAG: heme A synthase [Myxococcales bacterium]|nr:MAG: heme A synthase [Myxococcales bacterium]